MLPSGDVEANSIDVKAKNAKKGQSQQIATHAEYQNRHSKAIENL